MGSFGLPIIQEGHHPTSGQTMLVLLEDLLALSSNLASKRRLTLILCCTALYNAAQLCG